MVYLLTLRPTLAALASALAPTFFGSSDPVGPENRDDIAAWMESHTWLA